MNKNVQKGIIEKEFQRGEVREDHYDGKHGIYRLGIEIPMKEIKMSELENKLNELPIRPARLFLIGDNYCIDWGSQHYVVVKYLNEYADLIYDFIDYVDLLGFTEWKVCVGMLFDDPVEINDTLNDEISVSVFSKKNFHSKSEVETYDFRDKENDNKKYIIVNNYDDLTPIDDGDA